MIFTMTSCLHLPRKLEQTIDSLEHFFRNEKDFSRINRFILINEYDPNERNYIDVIKKKFPKLEYIQKDWTQRGQSQSINIILDILKKCPYEKYWLHWEESWKLQFPFINDAMTAFERYPKLSQVQVAAGWDNVPHDKKDGINIVNKKYHKIVLKRLGVKVKSCKWQNKPWPLFSLQPGIDKIENVINIGNFIPEHNVVPHGKVNGSEFNFSHRWFLQDVQKGVLTPFRCFRDPGHVSTSKYIRS